MTVTCVQVLSPSIMPESPVADALGSGPIHHETMYFADGDIILSVMNGERPTFLRLHRFMLSHFSPIFKDMLSIPSNPQVNGMYEGVPIVVMPDPYEGLVGLVKVLYAPE